MDENHLTKRLGRYLAVGRSATGLMGRYALSKALGSRETGEEKLAETLYQFLSELRGPLVKVAQLIAMIPDFMPEPYVQKLMLLQSHAPPMNRLFARRRMRSELGANWRCLFDSFEEDAIAAASLGQVHKARSLAGEDLACKLQYPDMYSVVEADLNQLNALFLIYKQINPGIDHQEVFLEIKEHLMKELDYTLEMKNIQAFHQFFSDKDCATIPKVYNELSTSKLLTMSWLDGVSIQECKQLFKEEINEICKNLFLTWYLPFYKAGFLHGDPHMGNYRVAKDHTIALYDFGCIRIFEADFIQGSLELYHALKQQDKSREVYAYKLWGFQSLSKENIEALGQWSAYLYGPLLEDRIRPIDEEYSSRKGREVAAQVIQKLREGGGVQVPRTFVFMDRAAVGLGSVFMHLKAELNWHQLFEELIQGVMPESIPQAQKDLSF
jgi:predicted unusual protein kinase regulating ubiquinone biosynthesis (AarF/ABC1/UbiB family)